MQLLGGIEKKHTGSGYFRNFCGYLFSQNFLPCRSHENN